VNTVQTNRNIKIELLTMKKLLGHFYQLNLFAFPTCLNSNLTKIGAQNVDQNAGIWQEEGDKILVI